MTKYIINSPRLGTVGEPYHPEVWVNIGVLISGGFIVAADDVQEAPKPAKTKTSKPRPDSDETEKE